MRKKGREIWIENEKRQQKIKDNHFYEKERKKERNKVRWSSRERAKSLREKRINDRERESIVNKKKFHYDLWSNLYKERSKFVAWIVCTDLKKAQKKTIIKLHCFFVSLNKMHLTWFMPWLIGELLFDTSMVLILDMVTQNMLRTHEGL